MSLGRVCNFSTDFKVSCLETTLSPTHIFWFGICSFVQWLRECFRKVTCSLTDVWLIVKWKRGNKEIFFSYKSNVKLLLLVIMIMSYLFVFKHFVLFKVLSWILSWILQYYCFIAGFVCFLFVESYIKSRKSVTFNQIFNHVILSVK